MCVCVRARARTVAVTQLFFQFAPLYVPSGSSTCAGHSQRDGGRGAPEVDGAGDPGGNLVYTCDAVYIYDGDLAWQY